MGVEKLSGTVNYEFEIGFTEEVNGKTTTVTLDSGSDVIHDKGFSVKLDSDLWAYEQIKGVVKVILKDRFQEALKQMVEGTVAAKTRA